MRAFFAGGADKMHLPWAVEALPFLIHVSLFLFFSGLIIFMRSINHSVYLSIISAIGVFSAVYMSFTCMPIFWPDSPYNTPLSLVACLMLKAITHSVIFAIFLCIVFAQYIVLLVIFLLAVCLFLVLAIIFVCLIPLFVIVISCLWLVCGAHRLRDMFESERVAAGQLLRSPYELDPYFEQLMGRITGRMIRITFFHKWIPSYSRNAAEKLVSKRSPAIDLGILKWTIGALGDDDTLEKFFEDIPGFFHSQTVVGLENPLPD